MEKSIITLFAAIFCLSFSAWADEEGNDTWQTASASGYSISGTLGYTESNDKADSEDWHYFDVTSDCHLEITIHSEGVKLFSVRLDAFVDETREPAGRNNCQLYTQEDKYNGTMIERDVAPGRYYIYVSRAENKGSYTININPTICDYIDNDAEPNDDYEHALPLQLNTKVGGHIGFYHNDISDRDTYDWYTFTVPYDGHIAFKLHLEQQMGMYLRIFGIDETTKQPAYKIEKAVLDAHNSDTTLVIDIPDIKAGDYALYASVGNMDGGCYELTNEYEPCQFGSTSSNDIEPNNSSATAQKIDVNQNIFGHLGYWDYDKNSRQDSRDFYQFEIPADGQVSIDITTDNVNLIKFELTNLTETGSTNRYHCGATAYADDKKHQMHIECKQMAAGKYCLQISAEMGGGDANPAGGYTFKVNYEANSYYSGIFGTEDAPTEMNDGDVVNSTLGFYHTDFDDRYYKHYFKLNAAKPNAYIMVNVEKYNDLAVMLRFYKIHENGTRELVNLSQGNGGHENISTEILQVDLPEEGTWLMELERNVVDGKDKCSGGYRVAFHERKVAAAKGDVRIHVNGPRFLQKGVMRYYEVSVNNDTYDITDPFLFAWDKTDDVILGNVTYNDKDGKKVTVPYSDISHKDGSFSIVIPYLGPKESVTFGFYAKGRSEFASSGSIKKSPMEDVPSTWMAAVVVGNTTSSVCYNLEDGSSTLVEGSVGEFLWKKLQQKSQVGNNEALHTAWTNHYDSIMNPLIKNKYEGNTTGFVYTQKLVEQAFKAALVDSPVEYIGDTEAENIAGEVSSGKEPVWAWITQDSKYFYDPYANIKVLDDYTQLVYFPNEGFLDGMWIFTSVVSSVDPNEMEGPAGRGTDHYLPETEQMDYTIRFENKSDATAPAYRVRISNELDSAVFDLSSVRFGSTSHEGTTYDWKMKREGNLLTWDIEGIELAPNVNAPEGEGYVTYTVNLLPGLADGTKISNKATIIFDENKPIETNTYVNVLDLEAPVTTMLNAEICGDSAIVVTCNSEDKGSGAAKYELYVSRDNSDYQYAGTFYSSTMTYVTNAAELAAFKTYHFYALATDAVGNKEQSAPSPTYVTDIVSVKTDGSSSENTFYNILGQKVSETTKGIVIENGKKYLK